MIGILLGGGFGTRLHPITKIVNKHLLPVFDRPMIYYPLQTLIDSGITKIIVICGHPFDKQVQFIINRFPNQSVEFSSVIQPSPLGMADAIKRCEKIAAKENVMVIAGDNIYGGNFKTEVREFKKGALSFLRQVKDPQRFGVPIYEGKKLVKIEEKPTNPESNWVVTGPHFFDKDVFKITKTLKLSPRGELEITDLNNIYLQNGLMSLKKRTDYWTDTGTFKALLLANIKMWKRARK